MICKLLWIISVALYVQGEEEAISEQKVTIHHQKSDHNGLEPHDDKKKHEYHDGYSQAYPSYEFSYKVNDPITHDIKGQHETREGDEVKGIYWLVDPNGHKRTVNYQANDDKGFNAQIALTSYIQVDENKSSQEHTIVAVPEKEKNKNSEGNTESEINYEVSDDNIQNEGNEDNQPRGEENTANNSENKLDSIELKGTSSSDRGNKYEQNKYLENSDQYENSFNDENQEKRGRKKSYAIYEESRLSHISNKRENFDDNNQEQIPSYENKLDDGSNKNIGTIQRKINHEANKVSHNKYNNRQNFKDKNQERIYSSERKVENGSSKSSHIDQRNFKRVNEENIQQNDDINRQNIKSRNKTPSNSNQKQNTHLINKASDNGVQAKTIERNTKTRDDNIDENKYINVEERSNTPEYYNAGSLNLNANEYEIRGNIDRSNVVDKKVEIYEHRIRIHHPKHKHNNNAQT